MQHEMPEMITLDVELVKDSKGLGVTIAGYTCEREELSGIFIKSVTEGSAAHRSGKVMVHDQIVEVDGRSIQGNWFNFDENRKLEKMNDFTE